MASPELSGSPRPGCQCVILAGGLATRLRPITEKIPKALIPLRPDAPAGDARGELPFIDYQLAWLAGHGVRSVVLSIGYLASMLRDHVGDGSRWGLDVQVVDEGADLRGTAGAIRLAADQGVLDDSFLVTYGDSFLPIDFGAVWDRFRITGRPALMTVLRNDGKWDASNACFDGEMVTLYDKRDTPKPADMRWIDYGLLAFKRDALTSRVPSGAKVDLAEILTPLSREGQLVGMEMTGRFYEIGSHSGLEDLRQLVARG